MLIQKTQISFSADQSNAFLEVSYDNNPLHTDGIYARRTSFGEVVFYGMGGVLAALAFWAKGRFFSLLSIQGSFHRPLLLEHSYVLEVTKEGSKINAKIVDGGVLMAKVSWQAVLKRNPIQNLDTFPEPDFSPLSKSLDNIQNEKIIDNRQYAINNAALAKFESLFGLSSEQIPKLQLTVLLWASYFIGMEYPGRRALFSGFDFDFLESKQTGIFKVSNLKSLHHKVFDLFEISGIVEDLCSLKLSAYKMPEIVNYPVSQVAAWIGKSRKLKGKKIFVSGAARGFGAVLSKALALQGATILLGCRKKEALALQVAKEIRSIGGTCYLIEADLSKEVSIGSVRKKASGYVGKLDWIINNASPRIASRKFSEQSSEEFLSFVEESLSIVLNTCQSLLPILNEGGWVFGISSEYLDNPKEGFSHYLASKSALEGFLMGLAEEYKKNNFAYFRAKRMLTDQTNLAADLKPPISAIEVANRFLKAFDRIGSSGNFHKMG